MKVMLTSLTTLLPKAQYQRAIADSLLPALIIRSSCCGVGEDIIGSIEFCSATLCRICLREHAGTLIPRHCEKY